MKQKLCDIISCPHDHEPLSIASELERDGDELIAGELACAAGHRFPVRAGVPRLHGDSQGEVAPEPLGTVDTFTEKWSRVSSEELEQRFAQQYQWYVQRFGFGDEPALADFLKGRDLILEAGTGLGGDAARFARLSDAEVIGLDFSDSVTIAHRHFAAQPNLHYVQADLRRPPFRPGQLDFVSADQVIHHTPDAESSFHALARLLGDGASFATYVYKHKAPLRELIDDWTRERTTKMSVEECMAFSEVRRRHGFADAQHAGVGLFLADDHAEQRRLAGAVGADDADDAAARKVEVQVFHQQVVAIALAHTFGPDHDVAEVRPRRDLQDQLVLTFFVLLAR